MIQKKSMLIFLISFSAIPIMACASEQVLKKTAEIKNAKVEANVPDKHPDVDYFVSCMECHQDETPEAVNEWQKSAHGEMNFGCYMCHGDGEIEFYPRPDSERCISCHSDQEIDFKKIKLDNCFDCHQGHSLKFHN